MLPFSRRRKARSEVASPSRSVPWARACSQQLSALRSPALLAAWQLAQTAQAVHLWINPCPVTGRNPALRVRSSPAVSSLLSARVGAQRRALGCGARVASWHIPAARSPGRTMARPLSFARPASVNRALLTAGAALTPEEFQKWSHVRRAQAPEAAAQSRTQKAVVWGCLCSCPSGWHFNGNPGWVGWVGGRAKREGMKTTQTTL